MRTTPVAPTAAELLCSQPALVEFVHKADGSDGYLAWQPTARRVDCLARMRRHELLVAARQRLRVRVISHFVKKKKYNQTSSFSCIPSPPCAASTASHA